MERVEWNNQIFKRMNIWCHSMQSSEWNKQSMNQFKGYTSYCYIWPDNVDCKWISLKFHVYVQWKGDDFILDYKQQGKDTDQKQKLSTSKSYQKG